MRRTCVITQKRRRSMQSNRKRSFSKFVMERTLNRASAIMFVSLLCLMHFFSVKGKAEWPIQEQKVEQKKQPGEHEHHHEEPSPAPAANMEHHHDMNAMMSTITGGPFKSMHAIGSGTSLLPASSPGFMWSWMKGDWMIAAHGDLKIGF